MKTDRGKKHEEAIAQFIPTAVRKANRLIIKENYGIHEDWADAWNRVFHSEMDRLTKEAGLRKEIPRHGFL